MEKNYNIKYNIGKVKYCISFYDGVKTHKDGSAFYNIKTFTNKKKLSLFERELISLGYKQI